MSRRSRRSRPSQGRRFIDAVVSFIGTSALFLCCAFFLADEFKDEFENELSDFTLLLSNFAPLCFIMLGAFVLLLVAGWLIQLRQNQTFILQKKSFIDLDPGQFEVQINYMLQQSGYQTTYHGNVYKSDKGVDIRATKDGKRYIIQCKRYVPKNKITAPEMDKFLGTMFRENADIGIYVTTSDFTQPARDRCIGLPKPVKLINLNKLVEWQATLSPPKPVPQPPDPALVKFVKLLKRRDRFVARFTIFVIVFCILGSLLVITVLTVALSSGELMLELAIPLVLFLSTIASLVSMFSFLIATTISKLFIRKPHPNETIQSPALYQRQRNSVFSIALFGTILSTCCCSGVFPTDLPNYKAFIPVIIGVGHGFVGSLVAGWLVGLVISHLENA